MRFCLIDFESASNCDLKKCGAHVYAADPTTEILCLGVTIDGAEPYVLSRGDIAYPNIYADFEYKARELRFAACDPDFMFIAHNAAFEKALWREIMVRVYDYNDIPNERWHDILASCAMHGLPLGLDRAASALHLKSQKDKAGSKLTIGLSKPNKHGALDRSDATLQRVMDYCKDDIHAELELHRVVRGLGVEERKVWLLDQTINERGVRLDIPFIAAAQKIVDDATVPLLAEFRNLTGIDKLASPALLKWANERGANIPNLQKETIAKYLGEPDAEEDESIAGDEEDYQAGEQFHLPFDCRRALEIRSILGSASIKKLGAMRACCGFDGRARGLLQYHGAGPGRWAGRLLQPQNFPRPTTRVGKDFAAPEDLVNAILTGDAGYVNTLFGNPIAAVASSLRHSIIASEGNRLTVGDFATIEARIVLALAGQHDKTALIASGQDIYIDMAQTIFGGVVDKKRDPEKRQVGKNTVLGCGFQMGWKKFRARYAQDHDEAFARSCIDAYRKEFAPEVPKLWWGLERAAVNAVLRGGPWDHAGIVYRLEEGWLTCRLPSGRKLWYRDPFIKNIPPPWDPLVPRPVLHYRQWKKGQWMVVQSYGGMLTENVVQATARDMLVHALFACERENLPLVLTVHDEAVTDAPGDNAKMLEQLMVDQPQWVKNLQVPVGAGCWSGTRYRK